MENGVVTSRVKGVDIVLDNKIWTCLAKFRTRRRVTS